MNTISLLLADDHTLVRQGIRSLAEEFPFVGRILEASNGLDAYAMIVKEQPEIALLDISMPGKTGIDVLRSLQHLKIPTRCIILSMYTYPEYVQSAFAGGGWGYIVKDAAVDELEAAIRTVLNGNRYISPQLSNALSGIIAGTIGPASDITPLSARETEVLKMLALGRNTKEIGTILQVSPKTIEAHRSNIMSKLSIHDIAGLVRYSIRNGLISQHD